MQQVIRLGLSFFLSLTILGTYGQTRHEQVLFLPNTIDQDIVYDQVEHMLIDRDGFVWLATTTGLHMYDGNEYHLFVHYSSDTTSISENFATTLFEDSQGNIWVGTYNNGVNVYDKRYRTFSNYRVDQSQSSLSSNKIPRKSNAIIEDKDGAIWVSTAKGLNRIDRQSHGVTQYPEVPEGQLAYDSLEGVIWVAGQQLFRFDLDLKKSTQVWSHPMISTFSDITLDSLGNIILGSSTGLWLYEKQTKHTANLFEAIGVDQPQGTFSAFYRDDKGCFWIGVDKSLYRYEYFKKSIQKFSYRPGQKEGLLDENIRGIYGDQNGHLYVTYESRGLTKVRIGNNQFRFIQIENEGVQYSNIRSLMKDSQGDLWFGTYNFGLNRMDEQHEITQFSNNPSDKNSLSADFITAIYEDSQHRLWVGTFENGFCLAEHFLNEEALSFERFFSEEKLEVHEFTEDESGNIWISTDAGFLIYDHDLDSVRLYGKENGENAIVQDLNIQASQMDSLGNIWMASWNQGLGLLSRNNQGSHDYQNIQPWIDQNGEALDNRLINLMFAKNGTLWLASSSSGLIRVKWEAGQYRLKKYGIEEGAPSNSIYAMVEDGTGHLWLSTANGLARFDPINESFTNFYESDGLLSNSFVWDAYVQSTDGEIFFGNVEGIVHLNPKDISIRSPQPTPYLTKLIINHHPVRIGEELNDRVILPQDVRYTSSIQLFYDEANFSFEYAALANVEAQDVKFSYRLLGFEDQWFSNLTDSRLATYTNLAPGDYTFQVRATKSLGSWNDELVSIDIKILPPWWRSWWAYLSYFLIISLVVILIQRELEKRSMLKHRLEIEAYKHQKDNELNQEKFKFFTNLSHELRTPLTLILGPVGRMLRSGEFNNRTLQSLSLIEKQAQRLQKLTNQLMNFRKYEIENLKLKASKNSLSDFVTELKVAFRQHAKAKGIQFEVQLEEQEQQLYFDADKLEIILVNLLSNAFKFTPENGQVTMRLKAIDQLNLIDRLKNPELPDSADYGEVEESSDGYVEITIQDSGVGIDPNKLANIFERYFRASNLQTMSVGGTGIGLEIAKNYVELHHGIIQVSSMIGKGTTFRIWLPKGKAHLAHDEIVDVHQSPIEILPSKGAHYFDLLDEEEKKQLDKELPTLLVADDNPDIIYFLSENFEKGFNVLTASNGKEALGMAFQHMPDVIISDIMMPEMDGLEFCRQIKNDVRTSHIPVLLLSARTANVFQVEGLETGADDYITKPYDERLLNIKVKNLVQSRKQLRERYAREITLMPKDISITSKDEGFLDEVIGLIERNIANEQLKVEWLAKEIGMSHSVLYKKIQALTDLSVVEFVRTIRIKRAAAMLAQTQDPIASISHAVGFSDPKYFSKVFQNFYGETPSNYRKNHNQLG